MSEPQEEIQTETQKETETEVVKEGVEAAEPDLSTGEKVSADQEPKEDKTIEESDEAIKCEIRVKLAEIQVLMNGISTKDSFHQALERAMIHIVEHFSK